VTTTPRNRLSETCSEGHHGYLASLNYTGEITRVRGWGEYEIDWNLKLILSPTQSGDAGHLVVGAVVTVWGGHALRAMDGGLTGILPLNLSLNLSLSLSLTVI